MSRPCRGCGDPLSPDLVAIGARTCGSCAVLLEGMEDLLVEPPPQPAREPGCDDRPAFTTVKPRHDGKWLVWACKKRGKLRQAQAIGKQLGLQRDLSRWTVDQVDQVVARLIALSVR